MVPFWLLKRCLDSEADMLLLQSMVQTYLVDVFTIYAASAMAAISFLRSIFSAFLPLGGLDLYDSLGLGWGNSLLAFISFCLLSIPIVFTIFGERIRKKEKSIL